MMIFLFMETRGVRRRPLLDRTTGRILVDTGVFCWTASASLLSSSLLLLLDSESESEELTLLEDVSLLEELDPPLLFVIEVAA